MKKLKSRAIICLFFAFILVAGMGIYTVKLYSDGGEWVSYPANKHIFTNGKLTTGVIKDINGETLIYNSEEGTEYNSDAEIRKAMVHATGDSLANISTGANIAFRDKMVGYNFITGVYSTNRQGRTITLTLDSEISKIAAQALGSRRGTVGVYNYKTGDIICMVSSPNYDPYNPPSLSADDTSGTFLNRFLSSAVVPGSIYKVITATAVIEKLPNYQNWTYTCTGSQQYGSYSGDKVTCLSAHGTVDLAGALSNSCNCAFGELANEIGAEVLQEYTEKAGLMNNYDINGITTKAGSFDFDSTPIRLAWTGIGQNKDLVNPCSMMVYMGAIANGGSAANPNMISSINLASGLPAVSPSETQTDELIDSSTAAKLKDLLRNNVIKEYGEYNFPGLEICAKSGTAEPGGAVNPHAWFTGFIDGDDNPYAFVVLVENGGYGTQVAGSVANQVLQAIVNKN